MPILSCPSCSGNVRVPPRSGQIRITCPRCSALWLYPDAIEYSDVQFHCSWSGARFTVRLQRSDPSEPFRIKSAELTEDGRRAGAAKPGTESTPQQASGLLALIKSALPSLRQTNAPPESSQPASPSQQRPAGEYDWSDFSCPVCGDKTWHTCQGRLACSGNLRKKPSGQLYCICVVDGTSRDVEGEADFIGDARSETAREPWRPGTPQIAQAKELPSAALPPPRKK